MITTDPEPAQNSWSRHYEHSSKPWNPYPSTLAAPLTTGFLILLTEQGHAYIDRSKIAYLQASPTRDTVTRRRRVLIFDVHPGDVEHVRIEIRYLTKGMARAPSYRVDITDPRELRLTQKAVIKNELEDFSNATLHLI